MVILLKLFKKLKFKFKKHKFFDLIFKFNELKYQEII